MVWTSVARAGNSAQEGNLSSELLGTKILLGVLQQAQEQLRCQGCVVLSYTCGGSPQWITRLLAPSLSICWCTRVGSAFMLLGSAGVGDTMGSAAGSNFS